MSIFLLDVNRSTFDEEMRDILNDFYVFVLTAPLILKFAPLVTFDQRYVNVSTQLEVSAAFLFRENRRHGTDGQTDRRTGCNS